MILGACSTRQQIPIVQIEHVTHKPPLELLMPCGLPVFRPNVRVSDLVDNLLLAREALSVCDARMGALIEWHTATESSEAP